jgi:hypothetical protein
MGYCVKYKPQSDWMIRNAYICRNLSKFRRGNQTHHTHVRNPWLVVSEVECMDQRHSGVFATPNLTCVYLCILLTTALYPHGSLHPCYQGKDGRILSCRCRNTNVGIRKKQYWWDKYLYLFISFHKTEHPISRPEALPLGSRQTNPL